MLKTDGPDVRLIDAARVAKLPAGPMRMRWIIKDLSQLWYSLSHAPANHRDAILERYMKEMGWGKAKRLLVNFLIRRKSAAIGRHDINLRRRQPRRNISIPE